MKSYDLTIIINEGEKSFSKKTAINASDMNQLSEKINALKVLCESLKHDDFMVSVELIKEKPGLIPVIKDLIREGEELSESQLLLRLPKYVTKVLNVLKS